MSFTPGARLDQAIAVLRDYADRRGMRISVSELEQALLQATGDGPEEWVAAAWRWLFPRERLASLPLAEAGRQHFPALLHQADGLAIVDSEAAAQNLPATAGLLLWVPQAAVHRDNTDGMVTATAGEETRPARAAILAVLKAHRPLFIRAGLVTLFINLLAVVSSVFAMQVYDRVVPNFSYPTLWALSAGVGVAIVFDFVFKSLRLALLEKLTLRADEALSQHFFERVIALKLDRRPARVGALVAQVRDYESVKSFFTSTTLFALADLPFCLFFIAVIALLGGWVALVPLVLLPICLGIGLWVQRPLAELQKQQTDESTHRQGLLIETLSGAENLKALGGEWRFSLLWQQLTRQLGENGERIRTLGTRAQYLAGTFQQLAYVLVLVVGVYRIEAGALTMGGLIACSILAGRAMGNISQTTNIFVQWQHARYALDVLDKLMALPSDDSEQRQASTTVLPLALTLDGVRYAYDPSGGPQMAVDKLRIEPGERVAVLGRNGSGKSTLLKLMAGLCTPNEGEVRIAGLDLQAARLGWLRETVGYLPQDVRLFGGTLRDNLSLGLGPLDEVRLQEALAKTGLDRFVSKQAEGLDCLIREGGAGLSGGQRQLIGLTRLVLQQPRIWLLDEATASLDQETEQLLMELIRGLPTETTVIFTTHRMSWLPLSRRTLLVEEGSIRADVPTERVGRGPPGRMPPPPPGTRPAVANQPGQVVTAGPETGGGA